MTKGVGLYVVAVMAGFGTGGIGNLIPSLIGTKWGRYDYTAAQRVLGPLTNFLKGSVALIVSLCLTKLNGYTSLYIIFMVLSAIAFVMFSVLDDKMIGSISLDKRDEN